MGNIKQAGGFAGPFVLGHDAGGVLYGKAVAPELDHAAASIIVTLEQWGGLEVLGCGLGHQLFPDMNSVTRLHSPCGEFRAPSVLIT